VSTYGLTDDVQAKLREMTVTALLDEAPHPDNEVRMRHIGAELAKQIVTAGVLQRNDWAVAIIDGVLSTELRRWAVRVERDEFNQSTAPHVKPNQEALFS
jgi:hypothetical protein